ncbi:MAG: Integrase catalytic region [Deltaproteobacteria bacterium]|nr:Integrase catalytic region [Deltaproteobacteria bacterium]
MLLTMKEVYRLGVLQGYMDGRILMEEAARILKRSARSVCRMLAKVREKGPEGVLHGNRNKLSPRRVPEAVRKKVIGLALGKYRDINDTHLCEILSKEEGIVMGRETLRGILRKEGIPSKRKVKRRKYRSRRERKEAFGMMLQIDASPHDWLQGRGPWLTLVGAKDHATGYVWAHFEEAEATWGYLDLMGEVISTHGVPEEVKCAAAICADLENRGEPIGPCDVPIAGTALANKGVLLTHNTSKFERIEGL